MTNWKITGIMVLLSLFMFIGLYLIFERTYHIRVQGVENFVAPDPHKLDSTNIVDGYNCGTELNYDIYQLREKYFGDSDNLRIRTVIHYFPNADTTSMVSRDFIYRMNLVNVFFDSSNANITFDVDSVMIHYGKPAQTPHVREAILNFERFVDRRRNDLRNYYYGVHNDFHHNEFGWDNALNIYIYNDSTRFSGQAGSVESNYFAVNLKYMHPDLYTLEHEIGHCLGLYHTHQLDISDNPHSQEDGDYICSTHKTFPLSSIVDQNCKLFRDWSGRLVLPKISNPISSWDTISTNEVEELISNVMSYTVHHCRKEFLWEQVRRMRKIFEMNSDMRKIIKGLDSNYKQNLIKNLSEIQT